MPTPILISYKNMTGDAILPHSVVELYGDTSMTSNGVFSLLARVPTGTGPYAIDNGFGCPSGGTGAGAFGQCYVPLTYTAWVKCDPAGFSGTGWQTVVGPVSGKPYMTTGGSGYIYAGYYDSANSLILVMQQTSGAAGGFPLLRFTITVPNCADSEALAIVTSVSCGAKTPKIGDLVLVEDHDGWFSGEDNTSLIGRTGTAHQFNIPNDDFGPYEFDAYGTDDALPDCTWVIVVLAGGTLTCS